MARRRKKNKWIGRLIFVVLLIAAGVVCYQVWDNYFKDEGDGKYEQEETLEEAVVRPEENNGQEEVVEGVKKEEVEQYDGEDPNSYEGLTGVVTFAGVSNGTLMIRVNIDQYLTGGTCALRLERNGVSLYVASANVISSAATTTCEGFDVPLMNIEGGGLWKIVIDVEGDGKNGTIMGEVSV